MINFYSRIPKSLRPKYHNPGFKNHGITLPFRMLVCGNSGSMKTNFVLNLIHLMNETFGGIIVVTKNAAEPLYQFLATRIPEDQLHIYEGSENVPSLESLDPNLQYLVIFDDLVLDKKQGKIEEYFIRARKVAKGVSCVYLSQSYFRSPKTIRINCNYIVLKKLSSLRDLGLILSDYSLGVSKKELIEMYRDATMKTEDCLLIDVNKSEFRRNFLDIYM